MEERNQQPVKDYMHSDYSNNKWNKDKEINDTMSITSQSQDELTAQFKK